MYYTAISLSRMRLERSKHLHSREHVLADDLSHLMLEPKRFASYLGIARMYHESDLRALAKRVVSKPDLDPKNRGKYFFGALRGLPEKDSWLRELRRRRRTRERAKSKRRTAVTRTANRKLHGKKTDRLASQ